MSTKDDLLDILRENRGEYISGSKIASILGVSGTAVWKAARKLQEDGYEIEAVTNKGYMLRADSDVLSEMNINHYLEEYSQGIRDVRVEVFDVIDSTNARCKALASAGEAGGYIAISSAQTHGRGRLGRSFYSPSGSGLYMSMLLRPSGLPAEKALRLTTIAAISAARAIEELSGKIALIKWVNDIYIDGSKVCGILTEASLDLESSALDYAVVGIGINLYDPPGGFPEEIKDIAGSVFGSPSGSAEAPVQDVRSRLAALITAEFYRYYDELTQADTGGMSSASEESALEEYRKRCFVTGRDINVLKPGVPASKARALGIDDDYGLIVRYEDGREETLRSGEISIRI